MKDHVFHAQGHIHSGSSFPLRPNLCLEVAGINLEKSRMLDQKEAAGRLQDVVEMKSTCDVDL